MKKKYKVAESFRVGTKGQLGVDRNTPFEAGKVVEIDSEASDLEKFVKTGVLVPVKPEPVDDDDEVPAPPKGKGRQHGR